VEKFFEANGLTLKVAMEMNKNEAIKQAVEAGLGVGVASLHGEVATRDCAFSMCRVFRCCGSGVWCSAKASV
jgi:DNA-binding transcriptional LysR family regulator